MADISMCLNKECKKRRQCYRFTAPANESWQTYADFEPDENGECEYFWDNKGR
jgi:hypothetical protein